MSADKAALFARLSPREKAAQLAAITRALQITAPAHVLHELKSPAHFIVMSRAL